MLPSDSPTPAPPQAPAVAPVGAPSAEPGSPSPIQRAIAIFVRPAAAWGGLRERSQWWIPMLGVLLVTLVGSVLIYHRAQIPTIMDAMEEKVSSGQMTADYFGGKNNVKRIAIPLEKVHGTGDFTAITFDAYDNDGIYFLSLGDAFMVRPQGDNGATLDAPISP